MKTKKKDINKLVGQRIKKARLAVGLSQQDLGEKVFKTGAAVGYIERGERGLSVADLTLFAQALNTHVSIFCEEEESEEKLLQETLVQLKKQTQAILEVFPQQTKIIQELKKMQQMLTRSREKYREFLEQSNDCICFTNPKGIILEWNIQAVKILGIPKKQAIGQYLWQIAGIMCPSEERRNKLAQLLKASFKNIISSKQTKPFNVKNERRLKRPDGKEIIIQYNIFPVFIDYKVFVGVIFRDMTAQRKVEAKLKKFKKS